MGESKLLTFIADIFLRFPGACEGDILLFTKCIEILNLNEKKRSRKEGNMSSSRMTLTNHLLTRGMADGQRQEDGLCHAT